MPKVIGKGLGVLGSSNFLLVMGARLNLHRRMYGATEKGTTNGAIVTVILLASGAGWVS